MARARRRDLLAAAVVAAVCGLWPALPALDPLRGLSLDVLTTLRWQVFGPRPALGPASTVVVAIDEDSYATLPFKGSPTVTWTREIGRVLGAVLDGGATVVGFDLVFPSSIEESALPFGEGSLGSHLRGFDRDFLRALRAGASTGRLVLGEVQLRDEPVRPAAGQRIAVGEDNIRVLNAYTDADGVVRRLPTGFVTAQGIVPSMAVELAARARGTRPGFEADGSLTLAGQHVNAVVPRTMTLNMEGGADDVPTYSLADLRACAERGEVDYFRRHFAGKVVLFGTLLDAEDRRESTKRFITGLEGARAPRCALPLPVAPGQIKRRTMAGVYLHATAVDNLLRGQTVTEWSRVAMLSVALGMAALAALAVLRFKLMAALPLLAGALLLYAGLALLAFREALALPLVEPLLAAASAAVATIGYRFAVVDREERLLHKSFALYLSPRLIDRMLESHSPPALGGEMREVTMFFSDIVGFSSFSETMQPQPLVRLMNRYLSEMSEIIESEGGYVDKYVGDSIVAVFGAPLDDADHAQHAVKAALRCRDRLAELNLEGQAFGGRRIAHRIGLNSGSALVGNIGSRQRLNYTAMSDAVNLASRLEGASKYFGTSILVAEATVALTGARFEWREIDAIRVKGRQQPVKVCDPEAEAGGRTPSQRAAAEAYAAGLAAWRARDFVEAQSCFARIAVSDAPAAMFEARARALAESPPGPDWEPVNTLEGK